MDKTTHTLRDFVEFSKTHPFRIPFYQRGYVWGKKRPNDEEDSVHFLLNSLLKVKDDMPVFLQGITTTDDGIDIIDGQQRLTTLMLFLQSKGCYDLNITYQSRTDSDNYLHGIEVEDTNTQDIYYFKKAQKICQEEQYQNIPIEKLLDNVKFLWIKIPSSKASKTFTMMNGDRAPMRQDELIKAELLRLASLDNQEGISQWENYELRGRYARTWDNWFHWWKQKEVIDWLGLSDKSIGIDWLLATVQSKYVQSSKKNDPENLTFESFKKDVLGNTPKQAKDAFKIMQQTQKRFEDAFNNAIEFNKIGGILYMFDKTNRISFINQYFTRGVSKDDLHNIFIKSFLGLTLIEIQTEDEQAYQTKRSNVESILFLNSDVYNDKSHNGAYDQAIYYFLRRNIEEDCKQNGSKGRKFDFSILRNRSIEHIYPKSLVIHEDNSIVKNGSEKIISDITERMIWRKNIGDFTIGDQTKAVTEHSLGNMVLLYGRDNSVFGDKDFDEKKEVFFNPMDTQYFRSRNLLHSVFIFAVNKVWGAQNILQNHNKYYQEFFNTYYE